MVQFLFAAGVLAVIAAGSFIWRGHSAPVVASRYFTGGKIDITLSKQLWTDRILAVGPATAYQELLQAAATITPSEGHSFAHAFGSALFQTGGVKNLSVCDSQLFWGCYHAFVGEAVAQQGIAVVPLLKQNCTEQGDQVLTGCEHGLGHGILGYYGYSLPDLNSALGQCDGLEPDHPRNGCAEGVFMEYNLRELTATDGSIIDPRPLSETGMYLPCTQVDSKYSAGCGFELPVWWGAAQKVNRSQSDLYAWMGKLCTAAPTESMRRGCAQGLGFNAGLAGTFSDGVALCKAAHMSGVEALQCLSALAINTPAPVEVLKKNCTDTGLTGASLDYCNQYVQTDKRLRDTLPVPSGI